MMTLRVVMVDEKRLAIRGIDPVIGRCLYELPDILRLRDRPGVRDRLLPGLIAGDDAVNDEWREWVGPELQHLFAAAADTVVRDLTTLDRGEILLPVEHVVAWMSALNQARLILGELHQVTEADMNRADFDLDHPRQKALLQIHLLGYLLQLFIEHEEHDRD